MQPTTPQDWLHWHNQGCTRLPAALVCRGEKLPDSWEGFADAPVSGLLESAQAGRYTFLCDRPERLVVGREDGAEVWSADGARRVGSRTGRPLEVLAALLSESKAARLTGWPAMTGGFIGAFGYDLVRTWERLPESARRDIPLPLYAMIETRELFVYDHRERALGIVVWRDVAGLPAAAVGECHREAQRLAIDAHERWRAGGGGQAVERPPCPAAGCLPDSFSREGFQDAVREVKAYLAAGHTYQTNLSLRTSRPAPAPAEAIYESVRRVNPSPYMGLLRMPDFALVCGSPELLVRMIDGVVVSRPIAGTRPRADDPARDIDLSAELFASEKERAEHLMLVDLIRNDIGRVAVWGSVTVREFMAVERYSHVMHLVSEVEGRLADGKTWVDVMRAMFPGGTITGCPKIRTMEIIEELEPVGRGFYTGSLGWISYDGNMEMNIIIRSMLVQEGVAHVQAGAGIVADSQPESEFDEAMQKARALWVAWEMAAQHG
ncbi:MAG: anthranilate synthase component I family protein [Opitutus sp.]